MAANLYKPHLHVLLEDDANRQILVGFTTHLSVDTRQMQLDHVAKGWEKTLERFQGYEIAQLRRYPKRRSLIVIDFDNQPDRYQIALSYIPEDLRDRVYVLGCSSEPEALTGALGLSKEKIGEKLATECAAGDRSTWNHAMLQHNATELERLCSDVSGFLFSS